MSSLLIPLIGPVINGITEVFTDKEAFKENLTTKTSLAGYPVIALGVDGLLTAQTLQEQVVYGVVLLVGVGGFFYRNKAE